MRFATFVALFASFVWCGQAQAGLIGTNVNSQYYAYGGAYSLEGSPASFVANGTVQETFCGSGCPEGFSLTVSNTQIVYDFLDNNGFWSTTGTSLNSGGLFIDNGNLLTFTGATISGVTLDPASNLGGFTASDVTFNGGNIAVNWAGISGISAGQQIILDVTTATATSTPEPTPWALLLVGLALIGPWSLGRGRLRRAKSTDRDSQRENKDGSTPCPAKIF